MGAHISQGVVIQLEDENFSKFVRDIEDKQGLKEGEIKFVILVEHPTFVTGLEHLAVVSPLKPEETDERQDKDHTV